MRIARLHPCLANANETTSAGRPRGRNCAFCKITTDEGIHGVKEGGGWPEVVVHGLREVGPLLVVEDPYAIDMAQPETMRIEGITGSNKVAALPRASWSRSPGTTPRRGPSPRWPTRTCWPRPPTASSWSTAPTTCPGAPR